VGAIGRAGERAVSIQAQDRCCTIYENRGSFSVIHHYTSSTSTIQGTSSSLGPHPAAIACLGKLPRPFSHFHVLAHSYSLTRASVLGEHARSEDVRLVGSRGWPSCIQRVSIGSAWLRGRHSLWTRGAKEDQEIVRQAKGKGGRVGEYRRRVYWANPVGCAYMCGRCELLQMRSSLLLRSSVCLRAIRDIRGLGTFWALVIGVLNSLFDAPAVPGDLS
jgi:hypothetical protein